MENKKIILTYIKKNLKTKLAALGLSGITLLSLPGCGKYDSYPGYNPKEQTTVSQESDEEVVTENNIATTTVPTTTKKVKTTKLEIKTEPIEETVTEAVKEKETKAATKEATKEATKAPTQAPTTTANNNTVKPDDRVVQGGNSNNNVQQTPQEQVQQPVEQPVVQQPVEQTMDPAEAERRELLEEEYYYQSRRGYTKNDMFSENAFEAKYAMGELCKKLSQELFNGHSPEKINGGTYRGLTEAGTLLVTLNYGQNINGLALGDVYLSDTLEEFQNYSDVLNLAYYQYAYGSRVDFNNYVVDSDLANFLNRVTDEYIEYMNGNTEPLTNEMNSFFENNAPEDNYIKYYFMRCTQNPYDLYAPEVEEARQMYYDNVVSSIYYQFEPEQQVLGRKIGRITR